MNYNYRKFGENIFNYLNNRGWNAMTKKEMVTVLVHYALESALLKANSINSLSINLKINPSGVRRLLEERALLMNRVEIWDHEKLITWFKNSDQTSQEDNVKGLGVYFVKDWSERISAETALENIGIIPDYKNNKQMLVIDLSKVIFQLSQLENIDVTQLVKNLLKQKEIELSTFNEEEFKANPAKKFKDILKEQASMRIGMKTTDTLVYFIEKIRMQSTKY